MREIRGCINWVHLQRKSEGGGLLVDLEFSLE